jgi:DNA-binding XRE family transcriptional regulator
MARPLQEKLVPKCNGQIKKLRLEAQLSQNKLARLADLDRTTVSSAENGLEISEITLSKLVTALSKALGRTISPNSVLK